MEKCEIGTRKVRTYNQFIQIQNIKILRLTRAPFPKCRYVGMDPTLSHL
jgi:hypothetical protein